MKIKRAIWKFPYNNISYYFCKDKVLTFSRNITPTTFYLDKILKCHKGNIFGKLMIKKQHLGHKLGEFFSTKVLGERIAYRKKQKILLKKMKNKNKLSKK